MKVVLDKISKRPSEDEYSKENLKHFEYYDNGNFCSKVNRSRTVTAIY